jgi:hypothetical protein
MRNMRRLSLSAFYLSLPLVGVALRPRFVDAHYPRFRLLACYRSSAHIVLLSLLTL